MPGMLGYELLKKVKMLRRRSSGVHAETFPTIKCEEVEMSHDEIQGRLYMGREVSEDNSFMFATSLTMSGIELLERVVLRWIPWNLSLKLCWILEWLIVVDSTLALWIQRCTRQFRSEDGAGRGT
ncbi:hypothetical protein HYC85_029955 [Camellia sinensis]|uniref:Uncharacterized protein n=1 Tax=Camellia sinensis TaxID=4442 RepID=A0A7J7G380_CAMSI|nr:hypothetical protein HYC85_029955 [Camellia sinensis]